MLLTSCLGYRHIREGCGPLCVLSNSKFLRKAVSWSSISMREKDRRCRSVLKEFEIINRGASRKRSFPYSNKYYTIRIGKTVTDAGSLGGRE